eukprot:3061190-Prymnesium_polylepis.1
MAATKATPGVPADPVFFGDRVGSARVCVAVSPSLRVRARSRSCAHGVCARARPRLALGAWACGPVESVCF